MDALAKGDKLKAQGRYGEACEVFRQALLLPEGLTPDAILAYVDVLKATSRYEEAENILLLLQATPEDRVRGLAERAHLGWLQHRYEEGYACAIEALRLDMFDKRLQTIRDRCHAALLEETKPDIPRPCFGHAAFYIQGGGNFGDVALPSAVRSCVETFTSTAHWRPFHVHQVFDEKCVERANELDGLIIGGGGLFLPDTSPNGNSGWQWNIPDACLERIEKPIAVLAVGYNLFYGQQFHGTRFRDSLRLLVEKASVVGLRNSGSIERVRELLPTALQDKVTHMPCPTTILDKLQKPASTSAGRQGRTVFLNAAFDRSALRFGENYTRFLDNMSQYITRLRGHGYEVEFAAHLEGDEKLARDIAEEYGIRLRVHGFYDMSCEEGYALYRTAALVVGMRGHATMIPFGLGVPVLSIISHPKMRFFLEDIDRTEWGVYIDAPDFAGELAERSLDLLAREAEVRADIAVLQEELYGHCRAVVEAFGASTTISAS